MQGLSEGDASKLRSEFISKAEVMFPARAARRQKTAAAGAGPGNMTLRAVPSSEKRDILRPLVFQQDEMTRAVLLCCPARHGASRMHGEASPSHVSMGVC